ncbi:PHD finger domain-containingprotein [Purpureocillium lavendulum]|uniref:PHD finger domain-containingprotein n=1 Tax=Purpureocillium lavendulum TaxID=1247861 RepID=A0AB34G916_9HYPO|nr:PHD finger domain-containingprotein [Purpureocillium lavendulum]
MEPNDLSSRPVSVGQEVLPLGITSNDHWAQKSCDSGLDFQGLEVDGPIGQAYTTDEAMPIIDLRYPNQPLGHGGYPLASRAPPFAMGGQSLYQTNNMLLLSQLPPQPFHPDLRNLEQPPPLPSQGLFKMLQSNGDPHTLHGHYTDLSDPPDLFASLREEQVPPPEEDMHPADPDMIPYEQDLRFEGDLYTPRWVRGHGNKREGWCGICKPGRWLVLKNSAFWYDKSFTHGISAATGSPFQEPLETRRMDGNPDVWEGICGSCNGWIALVSSKKKGTTWFRHAYKCHAHPKVKDAPKRRRETSHGRAVCKARSPPPPVPLLFCPSHETRLTLAPVYHSFGDPKAQPPTPNQTPTSAAFPSPVFETPQACQGSFHEPGGLTPRFAEEYSVFNATPGNLRGTQGPFADFLPATPSSASGGHKRLLSAEGFAIQIAAHTNHFSPNPNAPLPPVDPSRRLPSSPDPGVAGESSADAAQVQLSPTISKSRSSKKVRRGTVTEPPETTQIISPPPTARKGERKLAPKPNMQNDEPFGQLDFVDPSHQDMTALMTNPNDLFSYPLSAPATAPVNFWDSSMSMGMDLDFGASGANVFQSPNPSLHRHTGSFDWNADMPLFQDATVPPPSSNQENVQPIRRERALAPKPPASEALPVNTTLSGASATLLPALDDPFAMMQNGEGVNPGLLLSRPQTSALDADFNALAESESGSAEEAIAASNKPHSVSGLRRANTAKAARAGKLPNRAVASSPIKSSARPGLGRSYSENRGKKALARAPLPPLAPASRPVLHAGGSSHMPGPRSRGRGSGRISPSKAMPRVSSLAAIPEASPQHHPRTSVRFIIDALGRASAETTVVGAGTAPDRRLPRSKTSRDVSTSRSWNSSEDDDSTDDEPIIIPSRNNSFNASFALPDPRKPVGSIFHSSRRSISERSASNSANDAESEAETVVHERQSKGGDATSELRKVREDRQKRSSRMGSGQAQGFVSTNLGSFTGGIISPTSLTESSYGPESQGVRCVCDSTSPDEGGDLMVHWYVHRSQS